MRDRVNDENDDTCNTQSCYTLEPNKYKQKIMGDNKNYHGEKKAEVSLPQFIEIDSVYPRLQL
jgi:hypothetical protein